MKVMLQNSSKHRTTLNGDASEISTKPSLAEKLAPQNNQNFSKSEEKAHENVLSD